MFQSYKKDVLKFSSKIRYDFKLMHLRKADLLSLSMKENNQKILDFWRFFKGKLNKHLSYVLLT